MLSGTPAERKSHGAPRPADVLRSAVLSAYFCAALSQAADLGFYLLILACLPLDAVGLFGWIMALMAFVSLLFDLGLSPSLTREFSQHGTPLAAVVRRTAALRLPGAALCLVALGAWAAAGGVGRSLVEATALAGAAQWVRAFTTVFVSWLRAEERQQVANGLGAASSIGRLTLAAAVVGVFGTATVLPIFGGLLMVELATLALAWAVCVRAGALGSSAGAASPVRQPGVELDRRLNRIALTFGAIALLTALQNRLDWLMVAHYLADRGLAQYSMANKWYELSLALTGLALSAAYPWMCRGRGEITPRLAVFLKGVVAAVSLIMLVSALVGPEALRLLWAGKYAAGESAMRALLLGAILAVFDAVAYQLLLARGRERTIVRTAVVATAVQAALNIVLIPRWGILGAVSGMFGLIVVVGALNGAAVREEIARLGWGFVVYPAAVATAGGLILLISPDAVSRVLLGIGIWAVASAALLLPHAAELLYGLRLGVHVDKRAV